MPLDQGQEGARGPYVPPADDEVVKGKQRRRHGQKTTHGGVRMVGEPVYYMEL